jgi:tRNA(adenine34) deaminase
MDCFFVFLPTFAGMQIYGDEYFMRLAMQEAQIAAEAGEVPVGAVIVSGDQLLARCHNSTELLTDVTAHAEILAITAASQYLGSKYLHDCTLYVTLEPCVMCAGALRWTQISRILYATPDDKAGFMRFGKELLHPRTQLEMGILMEESAHLLKSFFAERRKTEI